MRNKLLDEKASSNVIHTADLLFSTPFISATGMAKTLGVTYPAAQSAINTLVTRGDLTEFTGKMRNRFYFATRIYDVVYSHSSILQR